MKTFYKLFIVNNVESFLETIPIIDKAKILAHLTILESGDFETVFIKTIKSPIKELRVKNYRIIFFIQENTIYTVSAFVKKTQKTPLGEIEKAFRIMKQIKKT